MSKRILPGWIEDKNRSVADHRCNVEIVYGVNHRPGATDSDFSKINSIATLENAVNITPAFPYARTRWRGVLSKLYPNVVFRLHVLARFGCRFRGHFCSGLLLRFSNQCLRSLVPADGFRRDHRKHDPENCTFSGAAAYLNSATMVLHNTLHNPEP